MGGYVTSSHGHSLASLLSRPQEMGMWKLELRKCITLTLIRLTHSLFWPLCLLLDAFVVLQKMVQLSKMLFQFQGRNDIVINLGTRHIFMFGVVYLVLWSWKKWRFFSVLLKEILNTPEATRLLIKCVWQWQKEQCAQSNESLKKIHGSANSLLYIDFSINVSDICFLVQKMIFLYFLRSLPDLNFCDSEIFLNDYIHQFLPLNMTVINIPYQ